jgi:hypothetical protein
MSYVSPSDLVRCADRDAVTRLRAKISLFLHYDDNAIAWLSPSAKFSLHSRGRRLSIPTLAARFDRNTLTHSTMAAPELSMQLIRD